MEVDRQAFEVTVVHVCMSRFGGGGWRKGRTTEQSRNDSEREKGA